MDEFIVIKVLPFEGKDEFVCLRWDSIVTAQTFVFEHYETFEHAKSACTSALHYPVKKLDYQPVMKVDKWNSIMSEYMRENL